VFPLFDVSTDERPNVAPLEIGCKHGAKWHTSSVCDDELKKKNDLKKKRGGAEESRPRQ
jgi:hypothetical protein